MEDVIRRIDFGSRISARAISAGILVALASFLLLLTLAAAIGLGSFTFQSLREPTAGFVLWSTAAWIVSAYFGGWVSAIAARTSQPRDGVLHGFVTWAGMGLAWTVLTVGALLAAVGCGLISPEYARQMSHASLGQHWIRFLGGALALCAALVGGRAGVRFEQEEPEKRREAERFPTVPTPQPT